MHRRALLAGPAVARRKIAIVAVARKAGGVCIKGKTLDGPRRGAWIRLVSEDGLAGLLRDSIAQTCGGQMPRVLDVFEVPLLGADPRGFQSENWVVAPGPWRPRGRVARSRLRKWLDSPDTIWADGHSSGKGRIDRVPVELLAGTVSKSVVLSRPDNLRLARADGARFRKVRARFD